MILQRNLLYFLGETQYLPRLLLHCKGLLHEVLATLLLLFTIPEPTRDFRLDLILSRLILLTRPDTCSQRKTKLSTLAETSII